MGSNQSSPLLLASVLSAAEAGQALREEVDVLDVKDPREGSLGAPAPAVLRAVVALRDAARPAAEASGPGTPRVRVSAALGDAPGLPGTFGLAAAGAVACGADDLKVGLYGLRSRDGARAFLAAVVDAARAPGGSRVRVIAAAYAEAESLGTLPPSALPEVARLAGADGCLVDTARKDGRCLFDHMDAPALAGFIDECRCRGLLSGLSGSLGLEHVPRLLELGPDVVGLRGAICRGGRGGRLDPARLREFRDALRGARPASRPPSGGATA